jgi:mono/diheme cytochrome c family protein
MLRWLKRIGIAILTLILLIAVAIGSMYAIVGRKIAKRYPTEVAAVAIPTDSAAIERGRHLVEAVNKCVGCHGDNLGGKKFSDDAMFGRLYAANLTSGNGGVGAGYTDVDWVRSIRHGIGSDGRPLIFMPSDKFYEMSDADLGAVIAYVKTAKPVDFVPPQKRVGVLARVLSLTVGFPLIPAEKIPTGARPHPAVPAGGTAEYGKYLTTIGDCAGCHGPSLSGGQPIDGVPSANLTPTGLKGWTEADLVKAMRTGVRPGGRVLSAAMPWPYVGKMTDEELHATWLYLQTIPAKKTGE